MAEGKKSFVLYADLLPKVEHLTNEEMGMLFRHMLEYVNDLSPILEDRLVMTAWKPIEVSLKSDLKRWEEIREKRSEAGTKGGRPQKAKKANAFEEKQTEAKKAVTVTVTDTVTVEEDKSSSQGRGPNFEEWKAYWDSEQKDSSHHNCRNSFLYYEEKGWTDKNGNEVNNWKNKVRNTSWWIECPTKEIDLRDPSVIAKVPQAFIQFCKEKWGDDKKQAVGRWKHPDQGYAYRKIHYFPDPNLFI